MIVYREWVVEKSTIEKKWNNQPWAFRGWFLFNVIPLYIKRIGV